MSYYNYIKENGASQLRSPIEPISRAQIAQYAPSILAEAPHSSRSPRYGYVPTTQLLEGFEQEGFLVHAVGQGGVRHDDRRGFTKHFIRLRHQSQGPLETQRQFTEISVVNSHDGTGATIVSAALLVLACLNGLEVSNATIGEVRIPHRQGSIHGILEGAHRILGTLPVVTEAIQSWDGLLLTDEERGQFATQALALRFDEGKAPVSPVELLRPRRQNDLGVSLWTTLNVVQENLIRGGIGFTRTTEKGVLQHRKTRAINGLSGACDINKGLWDLAAGVAADRTVLAS